MIDVPKEKFILDACCGGRMFWFNKHHPNTLYIDIRTTQKGYIKTHAGHEVKPDIVMDFRDLKFPNNSFKLVVFDPPHTFASTDNRNVLKQYGSLNKVTWKEDIKKGFDECWRVLDDYGVLVFKWFDKSIKVNDLIKVLGRTPLFGRRNPNTTIHTYWFCFMKIPEVG